MDMFFDKKSISLDTIEFAGYASVFNVIDRQGDVIESGSFSRCIDFNHYPIELLYCHNSCCSVGSITMLQEDLYGLYIEGEIDLGIKWGNLLAEAALDTMLLKVLEKG